MSAAAELKIPIVEKFKNLNFRFRASDLFNVQLFVEIGKGRVFYEKSRGRWYMWTGKVWREDRNETGPEMIAQEVVKSIYLLASAELDNKVREMMVKWALASESEKNRAAMIRGARRQHELTVTSSMLDADDFLFNCQNGIIDLSTMQLLPHDPKYLITKISPVGYNPDARSSLWDDTVTKAMCHNDEMINFLQKYAGLTLTGDVNQKMLLFLYGNSGNNLKSTITQALLHVMGDYGLQISVNTLMQGAKRKPGSASPDIAAMKDVRMILTSETEEDIKFNEQLIKDLTGRDMLSGRHLWGDIITFEPKMKIWIYGNDKPALTGGSEAMRNRLKLLPFNYQIQKKENDPQAQDKLKSSEHAPGVLAWMVDGYRKFLQEGIQEPAEVTAATNEYFTENRQLQNFFIENYIEDDKGEILFKTVYAEAMDFLDLNISKQKFSQKIQQELGVTVDAGTGNHKYVKGWRKPSQADEFSDDYNNYREASLL